MESDISSAQVAITSPMADWWHNNIYYMTIMKNRITTTITTMMLMLFSSGINVFAQSENVVPSGYPELDEWVK